MKILQYKQGLYTYNVLEIQKDDFLLSHPDAVLNTGKNNNDNITNVEWIIKKELKELGNAKLEYISQ